LMRERAPDCFPWIGIVVAQRQVSEFDQKSRDVSCAFVCVAGVG
jgi:hypothetical protein